MSSTAFAAIYSVRSKHQGEVRAHLVTRAAFLRCLLADTRVRDLFARWRRDGHLETVVTEWGEQLDAAAAQLGLPGRAAFLHDAAAAARIWPPQRQLIDDWARLYTQRLARARDARAADVLAFISPVLYPAPPPIRAWLGADLLDAFDADTLRDIHGDPDGQWPLHAYTVDPVIPGAQPMHDGVHLERNAIWYYRRHVAAEPATHAALAREYRASQEAAGVFLKARDDTNITERADTKLVRRSIADARRLLELTIPPEQWEAYRRYRAL
jgi:hypothetical protein